MSVLNLSLEPVNGTNLRNSWIERMPKRQLWLQREIPLWIEHQIYLLPKRKNRKACITLVPQRKDLLSSLPQSAKYFLVTRSSLATQDSTLQIFLPWRNTCPLFCKKPHTYLIVHRLDLDFSWIGFWRWSNIPECIYRILTQVYPRHVWKTHTNRKRTRSTLEN